MSSPRWSGSPQVALERTLLTLTLFPRRSAGPPLKTRPTR
jgi:hypothetical protein